MNGVFHAGAGVVIGGLALGGSATPADLAVCTVAGTAPDWDVILLPVHRPLYSDYHRTVTHGFIGLLMGGVLAAAVLSLFGWEFRHAVYLWLSASLGHTVSDLFNRSGVALFSPFSWDRIRMPLVSWGDVPLTVGAVALAIWMVMLPDTARLASLAGLAAYAAYLLRRRRNPVLSNFVSRWWFQKVNGPEGATGGGGPALSKSTENHGASG